jgi:hypothetical protein
VRIASSIEPVAVTPRLQGPTLRERQRRVRLGGYGDATGKMLDIVRAFFAGPELRYITKESKIH